MTAIELMIEEHQYIKRMLQVIRRAMLEFVEQDILDVQDVLMMAEFVKEYADHHHHGKEEKMLFNSMVDELGAVGHKLINQGMLVEHDQGRLYMMNLRDALASYERGNKESKLDIISNAISYTHLLNRHIDKEDNVIFPLALRELKSSILEEFNAKVEVFEIERKHISEKYISQLKTLEAKYL